MFGSAYDATIKNLNIENVKIEVVQKEYDDGNGGKVYCVGDSVGALVGFAQYNLTVENCRVGYKGCTGVVSGAKSAGGLVGRFYGGKYGDGKWQVVDEEGNFVSNSSNSNPANGPVFTKDHKYYGTLSIKDSTNYLSIGVVGNDKKAGIIGNMGYYGSATVDGCANYGNLIGQYAGGIVGFAGNGTNPANGSTVITDCTNYGEIQGSMSAGGIEGERFVQGLYTVRGCMNYGAVTAAVVDGSDKGTSLSAGGLFGVIGWVSGNFNATVLDSFNYGTVSMVRKEAYVYPGSGGNFNQYNTNLGGMVGFVWSTTTSKLVISGGNAGNVVADMRYPENTTGVHVDKCIGTLGLFTGSAQASIVYPYGELLSAVVPDIQWASAPDANA